jgi:CHAD domain-containing protein
MNSGLVPANGHIQSAVQPDWQKQFEAWRELLAKCAEKPSRRRVHALRVAILRLRAEVDFWLLDQDAHDPLGDAARSWRKQADKLRKALSPVRDTDVYLDMLKKLHSARGRTGDQSQLSQACVREIEKLEDRFQLKRKSALKDLQSEIKSRRTKMDRSSRKLQDDFLKRTVWTASDRVRIIRGLIAGLATELPSLSAETLHEFRKQAKMARYLSEPSAKKDPHAARLAALLKKIHNAAGNWHDWQTLASHARQLLDAQSSDGLVQLLEKRAEQSLENALEVCRKVTAQLLEESAQNGASAASLPPKKPVKRAEIGDGAGRKQYA